MMKIKRRIKKQKKGEVILVIDAGGRGHALVWKIAQNDDVRVVYCAPGNAGTAREKKCQNVDIQPNEIWKLLKFAKDKKVDLVVFGPENPLAAGAADIFENNGFKVFGPSLLGAMTEASKEYAKKIMVKYKIRTAKYKAFTDPDEAKEYVREETDSNVVVKGDGLAGGKAVIVCFSMAEAFTAIDDLMVRKIYGKAGEKVLIEERLDGKERSLHAFTDGKSLKFCPLVEDYKQRDDDDEGPNTGGVGVESPPDQVTSEEQKSMEESAKLFIRALKKEGIDYRGIIYFGFMIVNGKAYILEINCRFGDPECQLLMRRLKSDIVPVFFACADGTLKGQKIIWDKRAAIGVVLFSYGYPGKPQDGDIVYGLDRAACMEDIVVFHSGARLFEILGEAKVKTKDGRNFTVTSLKKKKRNAVETAYDAVCEIVYLHRKFRKDVGNRKRKV
jgi:phosphoribosylamine---glycine ligase